MRSAITVAGIVLQSFEQAPDLILVGFHRRRTSLASVGGWVLTGKRRLDGVARDAEPLGDRLLAQSFSQIEPTDLSPVLHLEHVLPP
jgi:hypothetical protein